MPGISRNNDTADGDLIPSQTTVFANGELVIVATIHACDEDRRRVYHSSTTRLR